jgi:RNA-directed DNA polymerase
VTGLLVQEDRLRPTRHFRRSVTQAVHYIQRFGYGSHVSKLKIRDPFYLDSLYGKLLFWHWIEPKNSFVLEACARLRAMLNEPLT